MNEFLRNTNFYYNRIIINKKELQLKRFKYGEYNSRSKFLMNNNKTNENIFIFFLIMSSPFKQMN